MPKLNGRVKTKDGIGIAVYNNLLKQKVTVKIDSGNEIKLAEYDLNEIEILPKLPPEQQVKKDNVNKNNQEQNNNSKKQIEDNSKPKENRNKKHKNNKFNNKDKNEKNN